jgi:hypothetical protein
MLNVQSVRGILLHRVGDKGSRHNAATLHPKESGRQPLSLRKRTFCETALMIFRKPTLAGSMPYFEILGR